MVAEPNVTNAVAARGRRGVAGPVLALVLLLALSGCSADQVQQWGNLGLPEAANSSAPHMRALWIGAWIAAGVVGVLVWGLILWVVVRYRRRAPDEVPTQVRYNLPIEVLYTIAPFVVIFVLFYHTVQAQTQILTPNHKADLEVLVIGQQWSWSFNHLGSDGRDKPGEPGGNDVFTVGTVADPSTLVLPVGKTVKFRLRSPDVIHSFWVPAFYFKMDVIPGRENSWTTTPTKKGTYAGRCAELCGLYHSRMIFTVKVVSPAQYQDYVDGLAEQGNRGVVLGSSEPDTVAGQE